MPDLKQPSFWRYSARPSLTERLYSYALLPASSIYYMGHKLHQMLNKPLNNAVINGTYIICVGNITAGGAGKTPCVIALYEALKQEVASDVWASLHPVILSKGFGGTTKGPHRVDGHIDSYKDVGDEPLLMARRGLPVIIAKNRAKGALYAAQNGHKLIIMDDGMQSPHIRPDYTICAIDGGFGIGNGMMLPAGPLREPLNKAASRIDAFICIGAVGQELESRLKSLNTSAFQGSFIIDALTMNENLYAFAGIGRPSKFYESLEGLGMSVLATHDFPDHHSYSDADIMDLKAKAEHLNARLVTTEKDAVKFDASRHNIAVLKGHLDINNIQNITHDIISNCHRKLAL